MKRIILMILAVCLCSCGRHSGNYSSSNKFKRADLEPETWEDCLSQDSFLKIIGEGAFEFHTDVRLWDPAAGEYKTGKVTYGFKKKE